MDDREYTECLHVCLAPISTMEANEQRNDLSEQRNDANESGSEIEMDSEVSVSLSERESSRSSITSTTAESKSESSDTLSLLSRLRSPTPSEFARRRKICKNPPPRGQRRSRGADGPKSVKPERRIKEYPGEPLTVSNSKLFCRACREELSVKSSSVKNHLSSKKHQEGKKKIEKKEAREQDIVQALQRYNKDCHPRGETLPESQQLFRVKVVRAFLQAGVPLAKIDHFRDLLEENGYRLSDRRHMLDFVPFILREEESQIKMAIEGRYVGVIFDGTTRLGEAMAIVLRFVSDAWEIEQRLVRVQLLSKSLTGEEIARELIHVLSSTYNISPNQLLAAMRDRASVNGVAMRTVKVVYPNAFDIGCFSHTIDRVGEQFSLPYLSEFWNTWIMLFSHSSKAKLLWKEQTGKAMGSYSATRWWSKWELYHQLLWQFGDILPFLQNNAGLGPQSRHKLLSFLHDAQKMTYLKIELASVIDWGESFVKATYSLEGDGPLVFSCYEVIQTIVSSVQVGNTPNVQAVVRSLSVAPEIQQQLVAYARSCIQPGLDYFERQSQTSLKAPLAAFKAARFFCPHKLGLLKPTAADIDLLSAFPFLSPQELSSLKSELPTYLAKADDIGPTVDHLLWWKQYSTLLPGWASAAKKVLLIQPSSAAAERVFSLLKSTFGEQQDNSLQDYIEASLMLRYNKQLL